jgi:cyclophilin family peptidyl-prolyl cis-trans isomerase
LVDKPGRRKKETPPWGKIAAGVITGLIVFGTGYYVYETYVYVPPPEFARFDTSLGTFYAELYPSCAPQTVANFVNLTQNSFYSNLVWHRIVRGFVIQTGDPNTRNGLNSTRTTWGQGGSKHTVPLEWCGQLHNDAGYFGMARQGNCTTLTHSGSSQFYIVLRNDSGTQSALDTCYTVFGKVISGMSVVCNISHVPTYTSRFVSQPVNPVYLTSVTMITQAQAPAQQTLTNCT